ncbi:NAD-dependent epimerase/dehydratase family protein [Rhodobacteraceae bacterium 2CG4]|uniref:NAD-dependent epimerase/dehydratase family protein n=1 Tax=Halovulum marinum TaxID=2662447 RepID=A0A6L5Z057_9RHOB|nr:NAD(P)-dependent oxidoreductase [Halovulum marinum]MSU89500.1 NAD-dependent epimerase/dehydratase family protein [Halovulum marinum]
MKRLLITGAAGGLGTAMRTRLAHMADTLRLSDIADMGAAGSNEELVRCDLSDAAAVDALVEGCDGIVHFGGVSVEKPWSMIRPANIDGLYNLYEAARKHGQPRIVFASSNHAIGFYRQTERIDARAPTRPDGLYGVSKVFGEALASMYHDKFGQETAIVRIGSSFPEPKNVRMLSSWLSYADFVRLIERVFMVPRLGCPVIYGASANSAGWWDNAHASYLGWVPQDNAETFREGVEAQGGRPAADDPDAVFQGGSFTADGIHED